MDPYHPWPPQKCTECQISDSHDSDEKIQRIDRLREELIKCREAFMNNEILGSYKRAQERISAIYKLLGVEE